MTATTNGSIDPVSPDVPRPLTPPADTSVPRDRLGRDARIHGLVLDPDNPAPTLRELLRQWAESGLTPPGDLAQRTSMVLTDIGPDGVKV